MQESCVMELPLSVQVIVWLVASYALMFTLILMFEIAKDSLSNLLFWWLERKSR